MSKKAYFCCFWGYVTEQLNCLLQNLVFKYKVLLFLFKTYLYFLGYPFVIKFCYITLKTALFVKDTLKTWRIWSILSSDLDSTYQNPSSAFVWYIVQNFVILSICLIFVLVTNTYVTSCKKDQQVTSSLNDLNWIVLFNWDHAFPTPKPKWLLCQYGRRRFDYVDTGDAEYSIRIRRRPTNRIFTNVVGLHNNMRNVPIIKIICSLLPWWIIQHKTPGQIFL